MKIIVFIKQVPETDNVQLDPQTGNLRRDGVKGIMNPIDANVIETALTLREQHGGSVAVVTMGPAQARSVLKKALGMGCDEAYLLSDRAFGGADTLATAYVLAQAAKQIGEYDLLMFGHHSTDGDTAQVGQATAAFLDIPQVTLATSVTVEEGSAFCRRNLGEKIQRVRVSLPAAITMCGDINTPRYAKPVIIKHAQEKPFIVWGTDELACDVSCAGMAGSPSRTKKVFEPEKRSGATTFLYGNVENAARQLADRLAAEHLI